MTYPTRVLSWHKHGRPVPEGCTVASQRLTSHHHAYAVLVEHLPAPPRTPSPRELLAGALADLDALTETVWIDRVELIAVIGQLKRALEAVRNA